MIPRINFTPAARLDELRDLLQRSGGMSVYSLAPELGVNVKTVRRYLKALLDMGELIHATEDGRTKIWKYRPEANRRGVTMTTSQMVALSMGKQLFDFLEGTGFKEDLDDVFGRLSATLASRNVGEIENLDRKFYEIPHARMSYGGRIEDFNEIVTALMKNDMLRVRYGSSRKWIVVEPYSLLVYRKSLYLYARSDDYEREYHIYSIDRLRQVEWLRRNQFSYPDDYDPSELFDGMFSLWGEDKVDVRIRLIDPHVINRSKKRRWHRSQRVRTVKGQAVLSMRVPLCPELENWVMGFGEKVEVLKPKELRDAVGARVRAMARIYEARCPT